MLEKVKKWCKSFWEDEEGLQTLELMLIIAVIVIIALMFRNKIQGWIEGLFQLGDSKINEIKAD